jgi:hypothetical protein
MQICLNNMVSVTFLWLFLVSYLEGFQAMSCLFNSSARSWLSCPRRPLSRTCLKGAEKCTQIGLCFDFIRCMSNPRLCLLSSLTLTTTSKLRIGTDWLLPALRKGEAWRGGRKLLDRSLRPGAPTAYRAMMEEKARGLLGQLLLNPRDFRDHVGLSVAMSLPQLN